MQQLWNSPRKLNRRTFIQTSMCTTGALIGCGSIKSHAIEPIQRSKPKFKYSLAAYSYRNLLKGDDAKLTLSDFISDCAEFNLEGTELTSYYFPAKVTHDYLRQLKQQCFRLGLDVSGTAVGNDFGFPPGEERQRQIMHVKQWIEYAEILGAPVIRIFAGHQKQGFNPRKTHELIVSGIEECCAYAGEHGVHLALENHGGPTGTADGLLALVGDVDSPWFGVNLDTGNFHSEDVYGDLARCAKYALNVQVKVAVSGPGGKKHPANFRRIAEILSDAHYRGYVVLEFEEEGDPREESRRYLEQLRGAFEKSV